MNVFVGIFSVNISRALPMLCIWNLKRSFCTTALHSSSTAHAIMKMSEMRLIHYCLAIATTGLNGCFKHACMYCRSLDFDDCHSSPQSSSDQTPFWIVEQKKESRTRRLVEHDFVLSVVLWLDYYIVKLKSDKKFLVSYTFSRENSHLTLGERSEFDFLTFRICCVKACAQKCTYYDCALFRARAIT